MNAPKSHACDACGGTGDRGYIHLRRYVSGGACPVCLGSGRISDRMPISDAVADAETLLRLSCEVVKPVWANDTLSAYVSGKAAVYHCEISNYLYAPIRAREAAHAAFRAVPGLRDK